MAQVMFRLLMPVVMACLPALTGMATYYTEGVETRNGEAYLLDGWTCAVPNELWHVLHGRILKVETQSGAGSVLVRVNDTGFLTEAGFFTWASIRRGNYVIEWFWPDPAGEWRVVVDLTPRAYQYLFRNGDFGPVRVSICVNCTASDVEAQGGIEVDS